MNQKKTIEILYKPYSNEVMGYIIRIEDSAYVVINSRMTEQDVDNAYNKLLELSASYRSSKFVLLKRNGQVQKSDNLDFLERAC